jgi:hypothetical protein
MANKLNEIFEANNLGFGSYDKETIVLQIIDYFEKEKRDLLLSFCDNVVWKDKREHITTERIDKFLKDKV